MKNFYLLFCLSALFLGCKKQHTEFAPAELKPQAVTFSVSHLLQTVEPFGKAGNTISVEKDSIKKYAKYLYCRIFPQNSRYNYITLVQTPDSAGFGTFRTKLTPGTYSVCFVASNQKLDLDQSVRRVSEFRIGRAELSYWEDLFSLYNYQLVVGDQTVHADIKLSRTVGAIELNLEDTIPQDAAKIILTVSGDASAYYFFHRVFETATSVKEFELTESDKGKAGRKFLMHVLNFDGYEPINVNVKGYDTKNNLLAERSVDIQRIYMNKKTLISGALFKAPLSAGSFSRSTKNEWINSTGNKF